MNSKNNTSSRVCQIFEKLNLEKNSSGQIIDFSSPNQRHPPFLYFWSVSYIFFAAKIPLPNYEKIVISYRFIVFKMTARITQTFSTLLFFHTTLLQVWPSAPLDLSLLTTQLLPHPS